MNLIINFLIDSLKNKLINICVDEPLVLKYFKKPADERNRNNLVDILYTYFYT